MGSPATMRGSTSSSSSSLIALGSGALEPSNSTHDVAWFPPNTRRFGVLQGHSGEVLPNGRICTAAGPLEEAGSLRDRKGHGHVARYGISTHWRQGPSNRVAA